MVGERVITSSIRARRLEWVGHFERTSDDKLYKESLGEKG